MSENRKEDLADFIQNFPADNLKEFGYMCTAIIAEIARGTISPAQAKAIQPFAAMMYTAALTTKNDRAVTNATAFADVLSRLEVASKDRKNAKYITEQEDFELPQVEHAEEKATG